MISFVKPYHALYVYEGIEIRFNAVSGKFLVCGELFRNQEQQKNLEWIVFLLKVALLMA